MLCLVLNYFCIFVNIIRFCSRCSYPVYVINIYMQFPFPPPSVCLLSNFIHLFIFLFCSFSHPVYVCHCWFGNWPLGCWVSMLIRIEFIFDIVSIFTCNWQLGLWVSTQINKNLVDEWKTNLMSLAILFHLLCAQHVSDINVSIFKSLRLC